MEPEVSSIRVAYTSAWDSDALAIILTWSVFFAAVCDAAFAVVTCGVPSVFHLSSS